MVQKMPDFKMSHYMILLIVGFFVISHPSSAQTYVPDEDLIYRINFGSAEDIRVLLEKGANPNIRTPQGDPVLSMAIDRNDAESVKMVKALLDKGANPNAPDKDRNLPIIVATRNGQKEMVEALMAKGVDVHVKNYDGASLVDIARKNNHPEIAQMIQDILDKENAYAASLRTPQRFKEIIHLYSYNSCIYQYWSYFLGTRQDPARDAEANQKIDATKALLAKLLEQIQRYYPETTTADLQNVSDTSAQSVYNDIDAMISNRNRAEHGVGTEKDAKERCDAIADNTQIAAMPAGLNKAP